MGISDRDYIRVGPRSRSGMGNLRLISFNTWLIVINVAVFVLNNVVLTSPQARVDYGPVWRSDIPVTNAVKDRAVPDKSGLRRPYPGLPGALAHPLYDPETIVSEPDGTRHPEIVGYAREGYLPPLYALGHFSTAKAFIHLEVWRFVTFQFLHFNWVHLLFNMFGLWFVGGLVEQYLGGKRYAAFYLVCGIFGALMYLLLNLMGNLIPQHIPGVLFNDVYTPLIGASAGVFGVLIAAAFIEPRAIVYVYFAIPMRLRTAVFLLMGVTLVNLFSGSHNAGGEAAHVGGALAGFYFIRHTHLLRDFFDIFGNSHRPERVEGRRGVARETAPSAGPEPAVDRILDKVTAQGLASLTDEEKRILRLASEARGP